MKHVLINKTAYRVLSIMIHKKKFLIRLLTIVVAMFATLAFVVHSNDAPFKSFSRSFVKQKILSSSTTPKVKVDLPNAFVVNKTAVLSTNSAPLIYDPLYSDQVPATVSTESVPPYRGPPIISTIN
jgi:hypothetical protein